MEQQEVSQEKYKESLISNFDKTKTYLGSHIAHVIHQSSFKVRHEGSIINNNDIKKGDCFWLYEGGKPRPAVVISFNKKTNVCQVIKLTSTDNLRNTGISVNSRFTRDCFYSYGLDIAIADYVSRNFFFHVEDKKSLNLAIKGNKRFFNVK